jgi:hypothetical protein
LLERQRDQVPGNREDDNLAERNDFRRRANGGSLTDLASLARSRAKLSLTS